MREWIGSMRCESVCGCGCVPGLDVCCWMKAEGWRPSVQRCPALHGSEQHRLNLLGCLTERKRKPEFVVMLMFSIFMKPDAISARWFHSPFIKFVHTFVDLRIKEDTD